MRDSGGAVTYGLSLEWDFSAGEKNVWIPFPVRLLMGKKPRTSSPMSTKAAFPWVYIILSYLCLGSENESSSELGKKNKIKVDNDHAREC